MATIKQKLVHKKIAENPRKSVSSAMREVGYSKHTASRPSNLTQSKGWKQLMDEYLPEEELAKLHKEQLQAKTTTRLGDEVSDNDARLRALDLAYKLRGNYKPTQIDVRSFVGWTPQELEEYASSNIVPERFITEG